MQKKPIVFVVDDSESILLFIETVLNVRGIDVRTFNNGKNLIATLKTAKRKPDIIILDQIMPEMEGLDTMRELSGNTGLPFHIPTILMTAFSSIPLVVEFMKAGGHDFIQKPLDPEYLLLKIRNLLKYSEAVKHAKQDCLKREKDELKTAFFSNVSHEIRTPMHAIAAFSEFAKQDIKSGKMEEALDSVYEIITSSERLMRIINDLLDLSKIESGKMEFIFEKNDVCKCISEVISELSAMADNKRVSLVSYFPSEIPVEANFDYGRITQVIRNLVTNAVKFCDPDTEVSLRILLETRTVAVSVENHGVPIPKKEQQMIFEKFFRSSDDRKNISVPGTGLGLSICKEIISAHGGKIRVQCSSGITRFRFNIPMKK